MKNFLRVTAALAAVAVFPLIAEETKEKRGTDWDGLVRARGEMKANYGFVDHVNDADWVSSKMQAGLRHHFDNYNYIRVLLQHAGIWGGQANSLTGLTTSEDVDPAKGVNHDDKLDVREAYFRTGNKTHALKVGRQIIAFGDQRIVGQLDWSNIGRSHDGIRYIGNFGRYDVHAWTSIANETNSADLLNNSVNNDIKNGKYGKKTATVFSGVYGILKIAPKKFHWEPYVLNRYTGDTGNGQGDNLMVFGSRFTNKQPDNNKADTPYDYALEFAYQAGSASDTVSYGAWASAVTVGYKFKVGNGLKLRVGGEFNYSPGDADPTDDTIGTFNNLYHTNHGHYGLADLISWQNMMGWSPSLTLFYDKGYTVVSYWNMSKADATDGWYQLAGGGAGGPTWNTALVGNETFLYHEIDIKTKFEAHQMVDLEGGFSLIFAGSAIDNQAGATPLDPFWAYLMATSRFK